MEKQEKSRHDIEERVAKGFSRQIEEFEEAIMSIEEQKVGIYAKLNEALNTHNQVYILSFFFLKSIFSS